MIFNELADKKFPGIYTARVDRVDTENKNGQYYVRPIFFSEEIAIDDLPLARSLLTNRYKHININVGDMVMVMFENEKVEEHSAVIIDLSNYKDSYPAPDGNTYGAYTKFKFGNMTIEMDEVSDVQIIIKNGEIMFFADEAKDITLSAKRVFVVGETINLGLSPNRYVVTAAFPGLVIPTQSGIVLESSLTNKSS